MIFVFGSEFGVQTIAAALPIDLMELDPLLTMVNSVGREQWWTVFALDQWFLCKATPGHETFPSTAAHAVYRVALRGSGQTGNLVQKDGETLEELALRMRATFKF